MLYYSSFSWVFSFLHLVRRGREDVAHSSSRVLLSSCPNLGTFKRAIPYHLRRFASTFNHRRCLSLFRSSMSSLSRRARCRKAGSGSAAGKGWVRLNLRFVTLEPKTSAKTLRTTSSLGQIQDTSCRDDVQCRHSRRTKRKVTTTLSVSFNGS